MDAREKIRLDAHRQLDDLVAAERRRTVAAIRADLGLDADAADQWVRDYLDGPNLAAHARSHRTLDVIVKIALGLVKVGDAVH